jgi:hypothetical protein
MYDIQEGFHETNKVIKHYWKIHGKGPTIHFLIMGGGYFMSTENRNPKKFRQTKLKI